FCAKFFVVFFSTLTTPHEKYNKYLFIMVIDDSRVNERDRRGKNGKNRQLTNNKVQYFCITNLYSFYVNLMHVVSKILRNVVENILYVVDFKKLNNIYKNSEFFNFQPTLSSILTRVIYILFLSVYQQKKKNIKISFLK